MELKRVKLLIESSRAYGRGLLRGIARYSHLNGPWSFVTDYAFYRQDRHRKINSAEDWLVDGIIAHTDRINDIRKFTEKGVPAVVQGIQECKKEFPTIICNDYDIGKMGAEYYIDKGFVNFAFSGYRKMYWSEGRCHGFCETVRQAGFKANVFELQSKKVSETREILLLSEWLLSLPKPISVMACNDDRSLDIVKACMAANLRVPDEVAILGVDNDTLICELSDFPLSSVLLSNERAGYQAAEMLDRMMHRKPLDKHTIIIEPLYVEARKSTDILAIADSEVALGVRYIKEHLREKITVSHVVQEMCLPRRTAEKRFKSITGIPINEMIIRERVNLIERLLLESDLSIEKISQSVGYAKPSYMIEVFKRYKKTTPMLYRKARVSP